MEPQKGFLDILAIARENVRKNPSIVGVDTKVVVERYLHGLQDEVDEVHTEAREKNVVYLTDELSDIAWDYAVLLALLEERGYIECAEDVFSHGLQKYAERAPAFREGSRALWEDIKTKQKTTLKEQHFKRYGPQN